MQGRIFRTQHGASYQVQSFKEKAGSLGRSYSLSIRQAELLAPIPASGEYRDFEDHPKLTFRFNLSPAFLMDFDHAIFGVGEEGYKNLMQQTLEKNLDSNPESKWPKNKNGEHEINF